MKKNTALIGTLLFFCLSGMVFAQPYLRIVQPYEDASLPPVKESFVFGSVMPATASLTINGIPIKPHSNGGFITMIPFQEGKFRIEAVANDYVSVSSVTRTVNVAASVQTYPEDYGKIDPLSPKTRVVLRTGDTLEISCQGAPGGSAQFRFGDGGNFLPMEEHLGRVRGIYRGSYMFKPEDEFEESDIIFSLKRKDGKKITSKAGASVTIQRRRTPRIVELKEDTTMLTGPDTDYGYNLFSVSGTRLEVTGEWGDFLRVAVGEANHAWIRKSSMSEMPAGSIPARSISRNVRIDATDSSTILIIPLQYRHPHRVEQFLNPHSMRLTLYGVVADTDRVRYLSKKSVIKEVTWIQSEPTTCVFDIRTNQKRPWGYDVRYEGDSLIIEIRHRPPMAGKTYSLKGLKIAVDAGHSPSSFGTIGPWGNTEAGVCLLVAKTVKQEMEKRGADVVMIQDGTKEISLQDRVALAWKNKAHLYISIHADACAEGQNPFDLEGYSVHYYNPQSRELAEIIHSEYGQKTGIRDQGLWRSNFAVCRPTQMISILLEQGFLMMPSFEEEILTPRFQRTVAESVISGILELMANNPQ